jgi:hypothetical protein
MSSDCIVSADVLLLAGWSQAGHSYITEVRQMNISVLRKFRLTGFFVISASGSCLFAWWVIPTHITSDSAQP